MRVPLKSSVPALFFLVLALTVASVDSRSGQSGASTKSGAGPAGYVNTFVGSAGADMANTYPGAALPFGMIQWSPDTTTGLVKHAESYLYQEDGIRGFSLNHLSGPGCPVMGDVLIQPVVSMPSSSPATSVDAYQAKFSHRNEQASPGYYAVGFDNGIKIQLTVTTRAGMGDFTFPGSPDSTILFNVGRDATGVRSASIEISGDHEIAGSVTTGGVCGVKLNQYTVYFAAEFNRPFKTFGTWNGPQVDRGHRSASGPGTGGFVTFDTTTSPVVQMKVALSYVSVANARLNLHQEIPAWEFDTVRQAAHRQWDRDLERISVSGGTEDERRVFYTALYHALLHPNTFSDVNDQYIGFDDKIHVARGFTFYANFSGWDIYRCEVQLLADAVSQGNERHGGVVGSGCPTGRRPAALAPG